MTPEEKHQRSVLASQVLDNPVYQEAITAVKADIFNQWANTKWFQGRKRKDLWMLYRSAEALESHIERVMRRGKTVDKLKIA